MKINLFVPSAALLLPITFIFFFPLNRWNYFFRILNKYIFNELSAAINFNFNIKRQILRTIFILILTTNLSGLLPYVYTITRQIIFNLPLALRFWLGLIFFALYFNLNYFLAHLVPLSTPLALSQFIVIIETIRQIIRPITLSVRLCANMTAGHILIALCCKPIFIFNIFSSVLILLILLEIAVAIIQRYVFSILLSIYVRENQ